MQVIGTKADKGYSMQDLLQAQRAFLKRGFKSEIIRLNSFIEEDTEEADILVVRQGINCLLQNTGNTTSTFF